jgi:hypothetical protein
VTRSQRAFRVLLRAYPARTREAYGEDMAQLFDDQLARARDPAAKAGVWVDAIIDTLATAPRERLTSRRAARVAEGPAIEASRSVGPDLVAALLPLPVFGLLVLAAPGFYAPLFDPRAAVAGMQFGVVMTIILGLLAAVGIYAHLRGGLTDGRTRLLVLAVFVVPVPARILAGDWISVLLDAIVASGFLLLTSVRWLSLVLAAPFVAWVLFGPAFTLILINMKT